mgnify:CR=1 FL=1
MIVSTSSVKRGLVAAVAVGALLLAGCSDDGDDAAKGDTSSETTVAGDSVSETTAAASETTAKDDGSSATSAPERKPNIEGFCKALTDVANQPGDVSFVIDEVLAANEDPSSPLHGIVTPFTPGGGLG